MAYPRTYVVHDSAPEPAPDLRLHGPLTWKRIFLGLSMTVLTGASGIIGSHVGGVTKDEMKAAVDPLATKEDVKALIRAAVAKDSTEVKAYVDGEVGTVRAMLPRTEKHRRPAKPSTGSDGP